MMETVEVINSMGFGTRQIIPILVMKIKSDLIENKKSKKVVSSLKDFKQYQFI